MAPKSKSAALTAISLFFSLASATPVPVIEARDLLNPIGASATADQEKWCPALDYDTDSCYNTVAISPTGQLNSGQDPGKGQSTILGFCRKEDRLSKTNIYVRSKCNNGWCAHLYDYYFESDFGTGGHRHDWEHIAVWVQNGQLKFVSASEHGKWNIRFPGQAPGIRFEGSTHPKIVYHKDGVGTHAFRYANSGDEPPENHWQSWRWGVGAGLLNWDAIPGNLRTTLSQKDWGSAEMAVRDKNGDAWNFGWYLDQSRQYCVTELECPGDIAPGFNPWA
ncbi:necrosis inducing protein-domain-containing protein [Podospora australis]|uniref:Necrosis inducing protein-domain-containing protein n=1 Tax=Podospora australis TaxID=1536484 RepID=A0AAN6WU14_9PEZI|nr:necrosis inducing protein-domain-containing protein [Podospora australis]